MSDAVFKRWPDADLSAYLRFDTSATFARWYFWNESWTVLKGPFSSREIAVRELRTYADNLDRHPVLYKWNCTNEIDIPDGEVVIGIGPDVWTERFVVAVGENYFTRPTIQNAENTLTPKPSQWRPLTEDERAKYQ